MIPKKLTRKVLAVTGAVLAAFSLALAACSAPSSSQQSAPAGNSSENTYVIEGFTGAQTGSDIMPESGAQMLNVPSVEVSYPDTWTIVETPVEEYYESQYGIASNAVVLEGPNGLRVSVTTAAYMGGGALGGDTNIEPVGPTGIEGVWFVWATTPQYGFSHPMYVDRKYIDEQEAGIRNPFPGFANLQEGYLYGSISLPKSGESSPSTARKNYADNPDLDDAYAILESVRLA